MKENSELNVISKEILYLQQTSYHKMYFHLYELIFGLIGTLITND